MLVALANDPATLGESLGQAVAAVRRTGTPGNRPNGGPTCDVVSKLMRVTALQLLLDHRPEDVPAAVADAWACEVSGPKQGERLPVGRLDRPRLETLLRGDGPARMLPVPEPTPV